MTRRTGSKLVDFEAHRASFTARAWDGEKHTEELGSLGGVRGTAIAVTGFKTTPELRSFASIEVRSRGAVEGDERINTATFYMDLEEARKLRDALGQVIKFAAKGVVD
jgi:hypothetical protein